MTDPSEPNGLGRIGERLDHATVLDRIAGPLHDKLDATIGSGPVADVLQGRWLGHPVHPMLTDIPIGAWTSAWLLDLFGGERTRPAADAFVALGVVAALPTVLTGWSDWTKLPAPARRTGVVHAAANAVATSLYVASLRARRAGNRPRGVRLAHAGAAVATVGGFLGGHLAFSAGDPENPTPTLPADPPV